ncbi:MAG: precorrin-2 dehydrogenase/sirohydrochlorin ferrochelatase family protein [Phycisphaerae bacterium]
MDYGFFPAFLRMDGKESLVVGGGGVALRKITALVAGGSRVLVVSPEVRPEISELRGIEIKRAVYDSSIMRPSDRHWWLVFAATNHSDVNAKVCADARAAGIWACNCSAPDDGDLISPASRAVGEITIAISTSGGSPGFAAQLADQAVAGISADQKTLAGLLPQWRMQIRNAFDHEATRRDLMRRVSGDEMIAAIKSGGEKAAAEYFDRLVAEARLNCGRQGR